VQKRKSQKSEVWIYAAKATYATLDPALRRCHFCQGPWP